MKDFSGICSDGRGGDHKVDGGHRNKTNYGRRTVELYRTLRIDRLMTK